MLQTRMIAVLFRPTTPTAQWEWTLLMFTKFIATTCCTFLLFAFLCGCSGQNDPYSTPPDVTLSGASCLGQAPTALENYLNAQATATQITGMWSCLSYSLRMFATYVDGQNKNEYTGDEL